MRYDNSINIIAIIFFYALLNFDQLTTLTTVDNKFNNNNNNSDDDDKQKQRSGLSSKE